MDFNVKNLKKNIADYFFLAYVLIYLFSFNQNIPDGIVLYFYIALISILVLKFHNKGFISLFHQQVKK